jgi:hypothetical protein
MTPVKHGPELFEGNAPPKSKRSAASEARERMALQKESEREIDEALSLYSRELALRTQLKTWKPEDEQSCGHLQGKSLEEEYIEEEPLNWEEAVLTEHWKASMKREIDALLKNKTWKLVKLPPGRKAIKCKWVYKIKRDKDGNVRLYKSRLTACGYSQKYLIDYVETFAPVGARDSLRMLVAIVAIRGWLWKQMDVDSAFLNAELKDVEIYMQQPAGFVEGEDLVCHLLKSIYGLKQASREWYQLLLVFLLENGFTPSRMDPCIFLRENIIIFIYVDDLLIAARTKEKLEQFSDLMKTRFSIKDLGAPEWILGMQVNRNCDEICVSQPQFSRSLLEKFGMENCKPVQTPVQLNDNLTKAAEGEQRANIEK